MINIKDLSLQDKGRQVIYKLGLEDEIGFIKSWNDTYIFVIYSNFQIDSLEFPGIATIPEDLTLFDDS